MIKLALAALLVAAPVELAPLEVERKCAPDRIVLPGYASNEAVRVVDGVVVPRGTREGPLSAAREVASIDITCWNPETNTFGQRGVMVIRVQTQALVEATQAPLLELIEAQRSFRAEHGRDAPDLASLSSHGLAPEHGLDFAVTETGWRALTPEGDVAHRCWATEASASHMDVDGSPTVECTRVDALALRSLRAYYEAAG